MVLVKASEVKLKFILIRLLLKLKTLNGGLMMVLLLNKPSHQILKSSSNQLPYLKILSERMDVLLLYVKDSNLIEQLLLQDTSDNMLKKYSKHLNLKTPGLELNKNISYSSDKEQLIDGL